MIRRDFLAGAAMLAALPRAARGQAKPRITFISQWSSGSDAAAINGLGKRFEQEGGVWQHNPVPGFTTEMLRKLRADIAAGDPPAASQLGPGDRGLVQDRPDRRPRRAGHRRRLREADPR